jgi:hypothetical protein
MNIWKSYTENNTNQYAKLFVYADIDYKNSLVDTERSILLDFFERNLQKVKDIFHAQGQEFIFISREKFSWVNSEQELLVFVNFFPTHYTEKDIPKRFFYQVAYQKNHFTDYKISYAIDFDLDFDKIIHQPKQENKKISKLYNSTYQDS